MRPIHRRPFLGRALAGGVLSSLPALTYARRRPNVTAFPAWEVRV